MGSRVLDILGTRGTHDVGNINSWKIRTIPNGAKCTEDIDNFTLVELSFGTDGRECSQLTNAATKKAYLIAAPENRMLGNVAVEELVDFYNKTAEYARIIHLDTGLRFETSAYTKNSGVAAELVGQVAHFDVSTKKFILSTAGSAHSGYATALARFTVVHVETDTAYTLAGKTLVRLEVDNEQIATIATIDAVE